MSRLRDPEGFEVKNLLLAAPLAGKEVLEIGCGEGWLTLQYANFAGTVTGIDPSLQDLRAAKIDQPAGIKNMHLAASTGETLPFSSSKFDISIFANSL